MTCVCRTLSAYKLLKSFIMHPMQGLESLQKGDKQIKAQALFIITHCIFTSLFFHTSGITACTLYMYITIFIPLLFLAFLVTSSLWRGIRKTLHREDHAQTTYFSHSASLIKYIKIRTQAAETVFIRMFPVRTQQIANNNYKLLVYLMHLLCQKGGTRSIHTFYG